MAKQGDGMEDFGKYHEYASFILTEDIRLLLLNYMLMKLGGQVSVSMTELAQLSKDYLGFRAAFHLPTKRLVLTMKVNTQEYPEPEIGGPSDL